MGNAKNEPRPATGFAGNEEGIAFVVFGLSFIPAMFMIGAATDYARLTVARAELQQGTDAATLSAAAKMTDATTAAQAQKQIQTLLNARPTLASATITKVTIADDKRTLCTESRITSPSAFMKIASIPSLTASARACANLAGVVDPDMSYEIALVVDNSGSMASSAGGVSKMQALKNAATSFVDAIYSKSQNVRMSVTPFSAGVVAVDPTLSSNRSLAWIDTRGDNSQHWIAFGGKTAATAQGFTNRFDIYGRLKNLRSAWDWGGCFEQPVYPLNVTDTAPTPSNPETLFVPYLAPDEPADSDYNNHYLSETPGSCSGNVSGEWARLTRTCKYRSPSRDGAGAGPNSHCPSASTQTLLPLSGQQSTILGKISMLREGGNTNLHEGFMWGWRTLSPNPPFASGRAYNAAKNRKIIVFMTDGHNVWNSMTNTATGSTYQPPGYYSYNGAINPRFPDGTRGDGVNHQTTLAAAANRSVSYQTLARQMQDELTRESCANAKAADIEIFTIGFSTPGDPIDAQGLALLKACATNDEHYFKAEDAAQLNAAFSQIGFGLGSLRLSE